MSTPSGPYYYKIGGDTFHWEASCSKNLYPDLSMVMSWERPAKKTPCKECQEKNPWEAIGK